jgi:hypothetical protein
MKANRPRDPADSGVAALNTGDKGEVHPMIGLLVADARRVAFPTAVIQRLKTGAAAATGFKFKLRNTFYCAQPLSCISDLTVSLNDVAFQADQTWLILRDQYISAKYVSTFHEVWWGFGESLEVLVDLTGSGQRLSLSEGRATLEVFLKMRTSISYGLPDDAYSLRLSKEMDVR